MAASRSAMPDGQVTSNIDDESVAVLHQGVRSPNHTGSAQRRSNTSSHGQFRM